MMMVFYKRLAVSVSKCSVLTCDTFHRMAATCTPLRVHLCGSPIQISQVEINASHVCMCAGGRVGGRAGGRVGGRTLVRADVRVGVWAGVVVRVQACASTYMHDLFCVVHMG